VVRLQAREDRVPDARSFIYVGPGESGGTQIWRRALDNLEPQRLPGTQDGAIYDVAPDGRFPAHQFDIDVETTSRLVLVDNWFQELEARVPR